MFRFTKYVSAVPARCFSSAVMDLPTIFALSSGLGKSGVAVVRVSGVEAVSVLQRMTGNKSIPSPRVANVRTVHDPVSGEKLDRGVVLYFRGPRSFTGEDVVELHVHGGSAVVRAVLDALHRCPGLRPADPGEFTKSFRALWICQFLGPITVPRAFLNGKMDLTEAEAVADLIHAETEAQRRQALRQMDGSLANRYADWRQRLLKALAHLEAHIDFSEEEHLDDGIIETVKTAVASVQGEISSHLSDHRRGERLRNGVYITIVGEPNVGKSSLLNAICEKPAAIVSPTAGTTRDIVELAFDLGGYPVLISDTAGLRETTDAIESEGVRRALGRAETSDLIILLLDPQPLRDCGADAIAAFVDAQFRGLGLRIKPDQMLLTVFNKCDVLTLDDISILREKLLSTNGLLLSCTKGAGLPEFLDVLKAKVEELCGNPLVGEASLTQQRHRFHLEASRGSLEKFWTVISQDDVTLAAHQVQQALRHLGEISGVVRVEEILDVIFKDFCIGK